MNRVEGGSHSAIAQERRWSLLLAIATAAAILLSGLNGLVQILKVLVEVWDLQESTVIIMTLLPITGAARSAMRSPVSTASNGDSREQSKVGKPWPEY